MNNIFDFYAESLTLVKHQLKSLKK